MPTGNGQPNMFNMKEDCLPCLLGTDSLTCPLCKSDVQTIAVNGETRFQSLGSDHDSSIIGKLTWTRFIASCPFLTISWKM